MEILKYRSKGFGDSWRVMVNDGRDFCVDAKIGAITRKFAIAFIDSLFFGKTSNKSVIIMFICPELTSCISSALHVGKYRVGYEETPRGILITFTDSAKSGNTISN